MQNLIEDGAEASHRKSGREARSVSLAVRFTDEEANLLATAAAGDGQPLREWMRSILLAGAQPSLVDPTFTELIALRMMMNHLCHTVASGMSLDVRTFWAFSAQILEDKHKTAIEVMTQYLPQVRTHLPS